MAGSVSCSSRAQPAQQVVFNILFGDCFRTFMNGEPPACAAGEWKGVGELATSLHDVLLLF
jgi:hypothetical protein